MLGKQEAILADARAFMKSRVLLTAAELDLFTRLDEKPRSAQQLAVETGLNERALTRILDALAGFKLLHKQGDIYTIAEQGELYSSHHPETVLPMVRHMNQLWGKWGQLTAVVKSGVPVGKGPGIRIADDDRRSFIEAMHVAGRHLSRQIAGTYDADRFRRLLDIGGGSGTYTIAFLRQNPEMSAVLFDFAEVLPQARARIDAAGCAERVELIAGDFYSDPLPSGCDLALLSAIIHQNSPAQNIALYEKIRQALEPGGAILIRDYMMDQSRTVPAAGTLFAINMLVGTQGGSTYTFSETRAALEQAGFTAVRLVREGEGMDSLVEAIKD